jgi:hypothetical protein
LIAGTSNARKTSGIAKSSDHDSGMLVPRATPAAVENCQTIHRVAAAPVKNHCL